MRCCWNLSHHSRCFSSRHSAASSTQPPLQSHPFWCQWSRPDQQHPGQSRVQDLQSSQPAGTGLRAESGDLSGKNNATMKLTAAELTWNQQYLWDTLQLLCLFKVLYSNKHPFFLQGQAATLSILLKINSGSICPIFIITEAEPAVFTEKCYTLVSSFKNKYSYA